MAFLTETQKELLNRFKLGDKVKVLKRDRNQSWASEWDHTELEIIGITWEKRQAKSNVVVFHDGDQVTDGFEVHDLVRA